MKVVRVSNLKGGEILGKHIFDDSGRVLINSGIKLSPFHIEKLSFLGVQSVYIDDEDSKEVVIDEIISEKTRQKSKYILKEMIDQYEKEGNINEPELIKSINSIIDDIVYNNNILVNFMDIRTGNNTVLSHSVNVCILAIIIGICMGYDISIIKDISLGAILHDIGKIDTLYDKRILDELNTKENTDLYIKLMHPKTGYDFLCKEITCSTYSKNAVLMHHERIDGSGYPQKLRGSEISEIAKILSVCDVFDDLISGKDNLPPQPVYKALEYLIDKSGFVYDTAIVKAITMNIAPFTSGTGVTLNTKEKCLVVRQNITMPLRPVVKVLASSTGEPVDKPYEIDLNSEITKYITGSCDL